MPDPFLRAHFLARKLYSLTGRISASSFRDQCVRADLLASRVCKQHALEGSKTILVVGNGISAGVLASALAEIPNGPHVRVSRLVGGWANIQRNCSYRYIDPFIYDWPHTHHLEARYPLSGKTTVTWRGGPATKVTTHITKQLNKLINKAIDNGRIDIHDLQSVTAVSYDEASDRWRVRLRPSDENGKATRDRSALQNVYADAVVLCGGLHYEEDTLGAFLSYRFWDRTDPLFVNHQATAGKRVLIVGSGDGAAQDFLYLLTGQPSARTLIPHLRLGENASHKIQSLNSAYLRNHLASNGHDDHPIFEDMHRRIEEICDVLWADAKIRSQIAKLVLPKGKRPNVQLACKCWHLAHVLPVNRVLINLVSRYLLADKQKGQLTPFRSNVKVRHIGPADDNVPAATLKSAHAWAQHPVRVTFVPARCPASKSTSATRPRWASSSYAKTSEPCAARFTDDVTEIVVDRVLLRIGSPPILKSFRSYRAIDRSLGLMVLRRQINAMFDDVKRGMTSIAARDVRQVPPFSLSYLNATPRKPVMRSVGGRTRSAPHKRSSHRTPRSPTPKSA